VPAETINARVGPGTLPGNNLRQVVHTHVPLSPSSIIWYWLHRWDVNRHITLAPYPWSCSVKIGVWLRALGNGDQRRPMGCKGREGLYVFLLPKLNLRVNVTVETAVET